MKSELTIQYNSNDISEAKLIADAKAAFKAAGNKVADVKKIELYVQPENYVAYFVINGDFKGEIAL